MSPEYLRDIAKDGSGIIAKILRDIKSSWKLMLAEMEGFLEYVVGHINRCSQTADSSVGRLT